MTRIRDWFLTLRNKRVNLIRSETVSFDAFNNGTVEDSPKIRESSLITTAASRSCETKVIN